MSRTEHGVGLCSAAVLGRGGEEAALGAPFLPPTTPSLQQELKAI